jgi:hypothetical protein
VRVEAPAYRGRSVLADPVCAELVGSIARPCLHGKEGQSVAAYRRQS